MCLQAVHVNVIASYPGSTRPLEPGTRLFTFIYTDLAVLYFVETIAILSTQYFKVSSRGQLLVSYIYILGRWCTGNSHAYNILYSPSLPSASRASVYIFYYFPFLSGIGFPKPRFPKLIFCMKHCKCSIYSLHRIFFYRTE